MINPEGFLNFNGKIHKNDKLLISPDDRSFRYGDGCFETIKLVNGRMMLENYHLERLFTSLQALRFNKPNYFITEDFTEQIMEVARRNQYKKLARVRVTITRGEATGSYDTDQHDPQYLIQAWDLNSNNNKFSDAGLVIDLYDEARKSYDHYSHIKHNNCLCYVMASFWAKQNQLNDVLILNAFGRIVEATIGNVFIVEDGIIKTPAISEGCVAGVMRKYLLKCVRDEGEAIEETEITAENINNASEIFLTNAIYGIRWVKQLGKKKYTQHVSGKLHKKFVEPLFNV
jgi:aminodeoxychorismate lyase